MSKNLCLEKKNSVSRGEYEGAGAPSCWIECLQTGCGSSPLRREVAAFWAAKQTKKRGIVEAVEKVRWTFSTA